MRPRRTVLSNAVFHLPGGTEDNDLWVQRDRASDDGSPVIRSTWELTDAERRAVVHGANIELVVWGTGTPPVDLHVTDVPLGAAPRVRSQEDEA